MTEPRPARVFFCEPTMSAATSFQPRAAGSIEHGTAQGGRVAALTSQRAVMRNARHIMTAYRRYLMAYKFKQNEQRSVPNKRAAAKRAVVAGKELVDA